jgi:hypothetical protein
MKFSLYPVKMWWTFTVTWKVWATGSILSSKRTGKSHVLTRKTGRSWCQKGDMSKKITGQTCTMNRGVCVIAQNANKAAAFTSTVVEHLWFTISYDTYCDARLNFMKQYFHGVHDGEINPTLIVFSGEICFLQVDTCTVRITGFLW